jgi:dolichol-phosphate mannosyltransferase
MTFVTNYNLEQLNLIKCVIAIPSYNEVTALPILIKELSLVLNSEDAVLILDDSPLDNQEKIKSQVTNSFSGSKGMLLFLNSDKKLGRGSAVRRGMQFCKKDFPNFKYFIECDADGSHQVLDIVKMRDHESQTDLLIGSRYLPESQIVGWPLQRKIFSRLLNFIIPKLLQIPVKDITNGLRRYSPRTIDYILKINPINNGFTYLSEQILIVHAKGLSILELPIIFIERVSGKSTVTYKEIVNSIKGILLLFFHKKRLNA